MPEASQPPCPDSNRNLLAGRREPTDLRMRSRKDYQVLFLTELQGVAEPFCGALVPRPPGGDQTDGAVRGYPSVPLPEVSSRRKRSLVTMAGHGQPPFPFFLAARLSARFPFGLGIGFFLPCVGVPCTEVPAEDLTFLCPMITSLDFGSLHAFRHQIWGGILPSQNLRLVWGINL
ncbi:hypothetical protein SMALB_6150 [Streptomyces malaysiensis]|uniref:Uncharacterized protein n=1 Tax=Streptomyces malaysiensis TaxID=92644 RepID=A0A7X5X7I0_STRMQ|nr:hypothetical protein [Streptomyces malaysiensis]